MSLQGAKVLTLVLAAACGALLLLAFALQIGFGRGYSWSSADEDTAAPPLGGGAVDRQPFKLPPEASFAETTARPLFNDDRKPTPDAPAEIAVVPPSQPLNISLTGVILTPQLHLAMIHDNAKNDPFSVKEGMPLPGDLGGWTLVKVKERSAMFKESAGDEVEVELSTAVASPKPGTPPPRPTGAAPATPGAAPQFGPKPPAAAVKPPDAMQAEQMQRRIEERRKQMRDEAERLKQQQNPQH